MPLSKFSKLAIQSEIDAGDNDLKKLQEFQEELQDGISELNWKMKTFLEVTMWAEDLTVDGFEQLKTEVEDLRDRINKEERKIESVERLQALHLIIKRAEKAITNLEKDLDHNAGLINRKREEIRNREIKQCDVLLELLNGKMEELENQLTEVKKEGNTAESDFKASQLREKIEKGEGYTASLTQKRAALSGELPVEKEMAASGSRSTGIPSVLSGTGSPFSPLSKMTEGKFFSSSNPSSAEKAEESGSDDDILPGGFRRD